MVAFKGSVNIDDLAMLNDVNDIKQLSAFNFQLSTSNADGLKKQLLQFSIDKNLDIVSLQTAAHSLEDVFRELTN